MEPMPKRKIPSLVLFVAVAGIGVSAPSQAASDAKTAKGVAAFATVQQVLQHPRCQNCHIPGDAPLQFDAGLPHAQNVQRGPAGRGPLGLACATCHADANPPASYGPHAPPGAPHWQLPAPAHKMVFVGLSGADLCKVLKDKSGNGGRDFAALLKHVTSDKLVLWGWNPGGDRAPVPVPHADFVAKFKEWADAGGPCPEPGAAARPSP
jgi:hypothetical protein